MSLPVYVPPPREKVTAQVLRERFRTWRRSRPFWGGVWALVAGWEMYLLTAASFKVVLLQGTAGVSAILICAVFTMLAVTVWVQPQLRVVAGFLVVFLSVASVLLTNLGGFLVGMLMGLHGGASMIAWKPVVQRWRRPEPNAPATAGAAPDAADADAADDATDPDAAAADTAEPGNRAAALALRWRSAVQQRAAAIRVPDQVRRWWSAVQQRTSGTR